MNNKTSPKDFFLHLGAMITLYIAVGATINLLFSVVNYYFPDTLAYGYYSSAVIWPISILVVIMPLFCIFEWLITKDISKMVEKNTIWVRRWRIYLTLFLTIGLVAGDLIALINTYLSGEISSRFIYKVLVILVISIPIFIYYLMERVKENTVDGVQRSHSYRRLFLAIGIVITITSVVLGFVVNGSPAKQRKLRIDSTRLSNLSDIQWRIVTHWQSKGALPNKLEDLFDSISGYNIPKDPDTDMAYEYSIKTPPYSFELCANFSLPSQDTKNRGNTNTALPYKSTDLASYYPYYGDNNDTWKHEAGRYCFQRTIDPKLYPINNKEQPN